VSAVAVYRVYELPWSTGFEQERRFKRLLGGTTGVLVLLALLFSFAPVAERDPGEAVQIPERFARLIVEPPPPPPPVVRKPPEPPPVEEKAPEPPEPVAEEKAAPEPEPEPAPPAPEPQVDRTQQARERASAAGLLPFAKELASLRDDDSTKDLGKTRELSAKGAGDAPATERSLITSSVGTSSGGINTAALSRNTGGSGLAGRETTEVASPVADLGPAGGAVTRSGRSNRGSRSREEIERVFDRNKGAIYALYNRALRQNPALQGKLVLRLTIASDGRVTFCEVVSSELGDPELEHKLVQRVLLFKFEPKDVEAITTTKPIDFFPA
jgi:protein TonB